VAAALALALPAQAVAQTFTFQATDSASGTYSYGVLDAVPNGDGSYTATGGYLIVLSGPNSGPGGTPQRYDLFPNPSPPGPFLSPSGAFIVDDQLFPGQDPTLDVFGLLFTGNGIEINIWGTGPGVYSYFSFNGSAFPLASVDASFILATTPAGMVEGLQAVVSELVTNNDLAANNAQPLQAKLSAALASINRGNTNAAEGQLNAFINQVNADIKTGKLSQLIGQSLIDQANAAIAALGG
jgi:hypothetical protein